VQGRVEMQTQTDRSHLLVALIATLIGAVAVIGPKARASTGPFNLYIGLAYGHADINGAIFPDGPAAPVSFGGGHSAYQVIAGARVL
jgi:hypothetical protein